MARRRREFLLVASALVAGCRRPRPAPSLGTRVVSISPSTTEMLFALGAGELVVGRSRFCDEPDAARSLPSVGGYTDPSLEAILALRPTLVTGARGPAGTALTERLATLGIDTYFPRTETLGEVEELALGLARRVGRDGAGIVARMRQARERVRAAIGARRRPRALLVFGFAPISCAGPRSFPGEMLAEAGGDDVVGGEIAYPTLDVERVLALDPDVVLDASAAAGMASDLPSPLQRLRAARSGRVVRVTGSAPLRPGPRIGEGIGVLAKALFADLPPID